MLIPFRWWLALALLFAGTLTMWQGLSGSSVLPLSADDSVRVQLAQRWAQKVASEVTNLPGRPKVSVARVVNDDSGILTTQLQTWIGRRNVRMANDQWYKEVGYRVGTHQEPDSIEAAIKPMLGSAIDYIVAAKIENWTTYPEFEARLVGYVEICDGQTGEPVLQYQLSMPELIDVAVMGVPSNSHHPVSTNVPTSQGESDLDAIIPGEHAQRHGVADSGDYLQASVAQSVHFPWLGLAGWGLTLAATPSLVRRRLQRLLGRRCNRTNGALLVSWLLVAVGLAALLWIRAMPLAIGIPAGLVAAVLSAVYFAWSCHCLESSA